ncbi:unnamed protein product [Paramecium primaurelia]|uniref:Uncharacterized protein n=1 Tax=Paramecium primaurelia TaxID=5886 RepID=A0A8S1NPY9_PARPR|nr:unnamed protein product [Paramecium primaurelia]
MLAYQSVGNPCLCFNGICYDNDRYNFLNQTFTKHPLNNVFQKIQPVFSQAISINDTKCGWLPKSKCQDQTTYSDANGANLSTCTSWGSTFVSDGKNVLIKDLGLSYLIPSGYVNEGTDRCYQWTGTSCILREFSDKVATSDTECLSYIFTSVLCITDEGKCVPRSTFVFYQSEQILQLDKMEYQN